MAEFSGMPTEEALEVLEMLYQRERAAAAVANLAPSTLSSSRPKFVVTKEAANEAVSVHNNTVWQAIATDGTTVYSRGSFPEPGDDWLPMLMPEGEAELTEERARIVAERRARAVAIAAAMVGKLAGVLSEASAVQSLYQEYFGAASLTEQHVATVSGIYQGIASGLGDVRVINWAMGDARQPSPDTTTGIKAFTEPGRGDIRLTASYWEVDSEQQAIVLLHEATHRFFSTDDSSGSGSASAKKLAARNPAGARNCAYNLEWFARDVMALG